MPIFIPLLLVGTALFAATATLWPMLARFFQQRLIPTVADAVGPEVGEMLQDFLVFLDKRMTPAHSLVRRGYDAFRKHVLGVKTTFEQTSGDSVAARTTSYSRNGDKLYRTIEEEALSWGDVPADIRAQMIRNNTKSGELDQMPIIYEQIKKRQKEAGVLLLDA